MEKDEQRIIAQAILNEVEGNEFYRMAANATRSEETKETFLRLAAEELSHVKYLTELRKKLGEGLDPTIDEIMDLGPVPSPEIYKWGKITVEDSSLALSALSIGIKLEKDSVEFYREAKEKSTSKAGRDIFDKLVEWETVHLNILEIQHKAVQTFWWADQGFAPY